MLQPTIFSWKVALAEMFIAVLDNQKQPSELFYKKLFLRISTNFIGKTCVTSFKPRTLLKRDSKTDVSLWNLRFLFFGTSILKNTCEQKTPTASGKYLQQYKCFVRHLFVKSLVWFPHKYNFKNVYSRSSNYQLYCRRLNKTNALFLILENLWFKFFYAT